MTARRHSRVVAWAAGAALLMAGCSTAAPTTEESASVSSLAPAPAPTPTPSPTVRDDASARTSADESAAAAGGSTTTRSGQDDGGGEEPQAQAPGTARAAAAVDAEVRVYDSPGGAVTHTFGNPTAVGAPLTFMVMDTTQEWVQVQLPVRPNGSTGWVPVSDVVVHDVAYALKVSRADNTLDVYRDGVRIHSFSVATGTGQTPTPSGTYYLTELIAPTNSGYGPYAYGISAFSDVLNEFGGGPGQIGLHGTDDEGSIGRAVSHGCIRLSNPDITTLAGLLPLGTPIEII